MFKNLSLFVNLLFQLASRITAVKVAVCLFVVVGLLSLLNIAGIYMMQILHLQTYAVEVVVYYFDLNHEGNIPTFFSSGLLLTAAGLSFLTAYSLNKQGYKDIIYWNVLGVIFSFLSLDEGLQIHEQFSNYTKTALALQAGGYLLYAWVIPYAIGALMIGIILLRFTLALPLKIKSLFIFSGFLYISGAVGLEMIEGHYDTLYGMNNIYTSILYTIEEILEMSGVIVFIYALLINLTSLSKEVFPTTRLSA